MPDAVSMANNSLPGNTVSPSPILIDGCEEDAVLARSKFLHRMEVLRRRSRRVKQLTRIYRDHYWALMEEVKLKYREYYWEYGKSPFLEDNEENNIAITGTGENPNPNPNLNSNNPISNKCGIITCKSKAMALTRFCHAHILSDPNQKLYKACNYVKKTTATGPMFCGNPVLRSIVPSLCHTHLEMVDKYATRAFKKAGLNISSTTKFAPKLQVILVEYVNRIQNKRRALKAALENSETKEDNCS
ncbi:INO80 complex subunit D-like [Ipomoea triloba]|uniref:INO80 complex subunit D-like n=1 Tax=Ipomoea triloba TaxID=35885 RepID=UPI00125E18AD|nr:INO80 complex subunit D-like [Ipomoea triloba]